MNVLVSGAAGFIGFHISKRLLESGYRVFGLEIIYITLRFKVQSRKSIVFSTAILRRCERLNCLMVEAEADAFAMIRAPAAPLAQ